MFEVDHSLFYLRSPSFFGPKYWDALYFTVLGFPLTLTPTHKKEFTNLLKTFHVFLPCEICRKHFEIEVQNVRKFDSRDEAIREVLRLHNSVRARLEKPPFKESDILDHFYGQYALNQRLLFLVVFLVVLLLLLLVKGLS